MSACSPRMPTRWPRSSSRRARKRFGSHQPPRGGVGYRRLAVGLFKTSANQLYTARVIHISLSVGFIRAFANSLLTAAIDRGCRFGARHGPCMPAKRGRTPVRRDYRAAGSISPSAGLSIITELYQQRPLAALLHLGRASLPCACCDVIRRRQGSGPRWPAARADIQRSAVNAARHGPPPPSRTTCVPRHSIIPARSRNSSLTPAMSVPSLPTSKSIQSASRRVPAGAPILNIAGPMSSVLFSPYLGWPALSLPTASSFRPCASIRPTTAAPMTGI